MGETSPGVDLGKTASGFAAAKRAKAHGRTLNLSSKPVAGQERVTVEDESAT